jgi:hypothetical protein
VTSVAGFQMDSLITAATRPLAAGDRFGKACLGHFDVSSASIVRAEVGQEIEGHVATNNSLVESYGAKLFREL